MSKGKGKVKGNNQVVRCPYCGGIAELRPAAEIHKDGKGKGFLYVCKNYPACNAYVGINRETGKPLGSLANGELRNLRIKAHRAFDRLWLSGQMSRNDAYLWMSDFLCMPLAHAHIGALNEYQCRQIIGKCNSMLYTYQLIQGGGSDTDSAPRNKKAVLSYQKKYRPKDYRRSVSHFRKHTPKQQAVSACVK